MFKRKFLQNLEYWKKNNITTPLLIIGARQVGKTFIVNNFIENNFEKSVYINFDEEKKYIEFFKEDLNVERIISEIESYRNEKINIDKTVFFFDEIQKSEEVIASLKYFAESKKEYKIICAGSLLGVKINRFSQSFPVGKVYFEYMYPMDFEEFLWAIDETIISEKISQAFFDLKPLPTPIHEKALKLYYQYLYIGGMPKVIQDFVDKEKDVVNFDKNIQQSIISAYLADMGKYAETSQIIKTLEVYNSIPRQLAKENKKFVYKTVNERAKSRTYATTISWLIDAGLVLMCKKISKLDKPLKFYEEANYFKLYLSDVGLLCNLSNFSYSDIVYKLGSEYRGILAENYIAQTFTTNKISLYYFIETRHMEIDFLVVIDDDIIPIEVKTDNNVRSNSLNAFLKKYNPKYMIRLSTRNFGYTSRIKSIPLYAAYLIK